MFRDTSNDRDYKCPNCGDKLIPERDLFRCEKHGEFFSYGPQLLVHMPGRHIKPPDRQLPWECDTPSAKARGLLGASPKPQPLLAGPCQGNYALPAEAGYDTCAALLYQFYARGVLREQPATDTFGKVHVRSHLRTASLPKGLWFVAKPNACS
jgi:hypothetical protein